MEHEHEDQTVEAQDNCELSIFLAPLTVIAEPWTYVLDDEDYEDGDFGATDFIATDKDGQGIKLRLFKDDLTELLKAGDTIAVTATTHRPTCPDFIMHNFEVMELWKIQDGRATSLYSYCRTVPAKVVPTEEAESD